MRAIAVALLLLLVACPKDPAPARVDPARFDERQACSADADCALVETLCCDHCNGGEVVGIHRDFAREARASFAEDCGSTGCTRRGCEDPVPRCTDGVCGLQLGDAVTTPMLPAP